MLDTVYILFYTLTECFRELLIPTVEDRRDCRYTSFCHKFFCIFFIYSVAPLLKDTWILTTFFQVSIAFISLFAEFPAYVMLSGYLKHTNRFWVEGLMYVLQLNRFCSLMLPVAAVPLLHNFAHIYPIGSWKQPLTPMFFIMFRVFHNRSWMFIYIHRRLKTISLRRMFLAR